MKAQIGNFLTIFKEYINPLALCAFELVLMTLKKRRPDVEEKDRKMRHARSTNQADNLQDEKKRCSMLNTVFQTRLSELLFTSCAGKTS